MPLSGTSTGKDIRASRWELFCSRCGEAIEEDDYGHDSHGPAHWECLESL
jgi:hypothetical protein